MLQCIKERQYGTENTKQTHIYATLHQLTTNGLEKNGITAFLEK